MSFKEILTLVLAVIGGISTFLGICTTLSKAGRAAVKRFFSKNTADLYSENQKQTKEITEIKDELKGISATLNAVKKVSVSECRETIKKIYYHFCTEKKIPYYDRKVADNVYHIYHDEFNENTWVTTLYNQIQNWEIIPEKEN